MSVRSLKTHTRQHGDLGPVMTVRPEGSCKLTETCPVRTLGLNGDVTEMAGPTFCESKELEPEHRKTKTYFYKPGFRSVLHF